MKKFTLLMITLLCSCSSTKWEYKHISQSTIYNWTYEKASDTDLNEDKEARIHESGRDARNAKKIIQMINKLGEEGWEVVSQGGDSSLIKGFILKKKK
jgi:hypothetical protein